MPDVAYSPVQILSLVISAVLPVVVGGAVLALLLRTASRYTKRQERERAQREDALDRAAKEHASRVAAAAARPDAMTTGTEAWGAVPANPGLEDAVARANDAIARGHNLFGSSKKAAREEFYATTLPAVESLALQGLLHADAEREQPGAGAPALPALDVSSHIDSGVMGDLATSVAIGTRRQAYAASGAAWTSYYFYSPPDDDMPSRWYVGQSLVLTVAPARPAPIRASVIVEDRAAMEPGLGGRLLGAALTFSPAALVVGARNERKAEEARLALAAEDGIDPERAAGYLPGEVELGDPAFDARFRVTAADPADVREVLRPHVRASLLALADDCGTFHVHYRPSGTACVAFPNFPLFDEEGFDGLPRRLDAAMLERGRLRIALVLDRLGGLW